ncbi:hypothetical protein [Ensifer adhaerens]|uniref:hypothetical protein n=1 Tax=Ensifer adhaerens TaxID=106592 RepID=UPI000CF032B8|nr:hypothetical protein [Ensifer adhaerens]
MSSAKAIQEGIDPHEHTTLQTRHLGGNPQCLVASRLMILDDLETGRLIPLFPVAYPEASAIYAVSPSTKALSPAVGSLLEYLTEVLCESGDQSRVDAPLRTAGSS